MTLLASRPQGLQADSLPGSIWNNNGRWWWRVRLPDEKTRRAIPLKAPWAQRATVDRSIAVQIAWSIWKEHQPAAGDSKPVMTVADLRGRWLASGVSPGNELDTRAAMTLADRPVDTVRAPEILELQSRMIAEGLSMRTINRRISAIVRMFGWGVPRDIVSSEQWWGMQAIAPVKAGVCRKRPKVVEPADLLAVHDTLAHCRPVLWRMIVVQMLTGMRSGELVRMRPCEIDQSGEVWRYRPGKHKNQNKGHSRVVAIGPRAQDVLADTLAGRPADSMVFSPEEAECERGVNRRPDQARPVKSYYTPHSYQQAIEYAIAAAGVLCAQCGAERKATRKPCPNCGAVTWRTRIEHWHAHQLRHLAGTIARRKFKSLDAAQALLGHRHARVTEIYAELAAERAGDVAEQIG